jgi:hypothetical protein
MGWSDERVIEDGLLNLGRNPVGMSPFTAGQFIEQALGAIADELAGFAEVIELFGG